MGYEDRDYFQSRPKFELSPSVHPATKGLLIAVVASYIIALVVADTMDFTQAPKGTARADFIYDLVVLTSRNVAMWAPGFEAGQWKLLTHWLVSPGLLSALIDALCVYFAGRMVEELFGTRRFLMLFVAACVLSGLLAALLDPLLMGRERTSVIMGPAAGAFATFVSLAWIAPQQRSMFGLRTKTLVIVLVGMSCGLNLLWGLTGDEVVSRSPTQLLFGAAVGAGYMMFLKARGRVPGPAPGAQAVEDDPVARSLAQAREEEEKRQRENEKRRTQQDAEQQRLDAILAKISATGIASLSRAEKSFLDSQSQKRKDSAR